MRGWDRRTYEFWGGLIEGRERNSPVVDEGGEGEEEVARRRMRIVGLWWKESRNYWGQVSLFSISRNGTLQCLSLNRGVYGVSLVLK